MNASFQRMMSEATRLTQAGDLHAATAAIQAALGRQADDVIDVEAREIGPRTADVVDAPPHAGQFVAGRHAEAGLSRDYKLYLPPGTPDKPLPLIVMLHGCKQDPDDFAAGTRMNEAALEQGFIVLYPAQAQGANPSRCWNWFKHNHQGRGRGEPALLAGMTREVMKRHAVDERRVYVAGLSAGGAMAAIVGAAYPDLFAAVGVHSGLPVGSAHDVKSAFAAMQHGAPAATAAAAPPTIVFHGDRDTTVHPRNGDQVAAARAGAAAPEVERGPGYTRRVYRDADTVRAEHWTLHGVGHAWSGGSPRGSFTDPRGPDATEEMLRFFRSNARP
ncbi:PHB depolymerase family esterase [Piscinibacter sp. XHJ-5]|uniref:extracellular catalytic domain type 1 short-chain-length polyhydroxyalkanoate depolymerase n=1 Tax=Piscinibacter sp. XHJ-5 TaxID=3037797 RepID=UPI002452DA10|nr:PHB depolymerase family esterase [Piscinibacter sp. XHJ-5]